MRETQFSILLQHEETGRIIEKIYSYADVFSGRAKEEISSLLRYIVIARRDFTGQKDYKKIEIYEGDIIQFTEVDEDSCMGAEETHIVSVEWISDISQWMCIFQSGRRIDLRCITNFRCIKECDVIGNIYENPELLTKEK